MDDTAALRRTIRRCTAILVIAIGLVVLNGDEYTDVSEWGFLLAILAGFYLLASVLAGFATRSGQGERHDGGPSGGDESGGPADGDDGSDEDGAADDGDDADQRPPTGPVGGPW